MNSHNKNFSLYFKTREKAVLAKGENFNYVTDYPQDLYMYDYKTKTSIPLISYEWFPTHAKYLLEDYDFPVFPEDFAYYLLKDNNTLIMISAIKNIKKNLKFDIASKKLNEYNTSGKLDFIISSVVKKCGYSSLKENILETFYMTPLDFQNDYLSYKGSGFSIAPYFTQSAWFRFHNKSEIIKNLILVGAGTHPGAGIPGVLSSAKVMESLL